MKKRKIKLLSVIAVVILIILLIVFTDMEEKTVDQPKISCVRQPVSMITASDLHYLAPELTDHGAAFQKLINNSDGKVMEYIEELTEAFLAEVLEQRPDLLVLSGDLTFNGAYESHMNLVMKLARIQEAGIRVLTIPGNHDLDNPNAAGFEGDAYEYVRSMTAAEFKESYADFGYAQAVSHAPDSLSYLYAVRSDLWILMLDTNAAEVNRVTDKTLAWVEKKLDEAQKKDISVITVSHQYVLVHNRLFTEGFCIENAGELSAVYEQYGVLCNLSGHMHLQHIAEDGITEILTSALSITPNQYGMAIFDGKEFQYQTKKLDVSAWAVKHQLTDENLLHFGDYACRFFDQSSRAQILAELEKEQVPSGEKELLADTFVLLNREYFSGNPIDQAELAEGIALWKKQPLSFYKAYILSILDDKGTQHLKLYRTFLE